jgi:hypothetical protein
MLLWFVAALGTVGATVVRDAKYQRERERRPRSEGVAGANRHERKRRRGRWQARRRVPCLPRKGGPNRGTPSPAPGSLRALLSL